MSTDQTANLLLLGATGDLSGRFLLPALVQLHREGRLPPDFSVVGAGGRDWTDGRLREFAAERLAQFAGDAPAADREAVLASLTYARTDASEPDSIARAVERGSSSRPLAVYLALPSAVVPRAAEALAGVELPRGSRVAVEKPFGEDLKSAIELNAVLTEAVGEQAIYRVDHALGMKTIPNLLALRLANRVFDSLWSSTQIAAVEILWEETLALEGRAGFYDRAGTLRDTVQNHMMQLFSMVAMEPPGEPGERALAERKLAALRAVRPLTPETVGRRTQRARYTAGQLVGSGGATSRPVPDYADEDGVDPGRGTETFAEVVLEVENERWRGTPFRLRAGKALSRRWKGVIVHFRPLAELPLGAGKAAANQLRIGIDGPENVTLELLGSAAGTPPEPRPLVLASAPVGSPLSAYGRVLGEILEGGSALAVRGAEVEEAWRILEPVTRAWDEGSVPLGEYPAGSTGPGRLAVGGPVAG